MKKRISFILLMASLFAGCATLSNGNPDRSIVDPEFGVWYFSEKIVDGVYTEQNLEYVARNGKKLSNLYATSGFYQGIAFVATCDLIKNDRTCAEWHYFMINPDGEVIANFENYNVSVLTLCGAGKPSSIFVKDATRNNGKSIDFPMFRGVGNSCGEMYYTDSPAFYSKRIMVYDKSLDRFGYFDFSGKLVIPATFKMAQPFGSNGKARVLTEDDIPGYINENGVFTPDDYMCKKKIADETASSSASDDLYFINSMGKIYNYNAEDSLSPTFMYRCNEVVNASDLKKENCVGAKVGVINSNSEEIIPPIYDEIVPSARFAETNIRYFKAVRDGVTDYYRYRYSDKHMSKFTDSGLVSRVIYGPYCALLKSAGSGLWNAYSTFMVNESQTGFIYDDVKYQPYLSSDGISSRTMAMRRNSKYAIVDCASGETVGPKFDDIIFRSDENSTDLVVTIKNKKYGLVVNHSELFEPVFDWIDEFEDDKALVKIGQKKYYIFINSEKEKSYTRMGQHRSNRNGPFIPVYSPHLADD